MKNPPAINGKCVSLRPFKLEDATIYSSWLRDAELRELVGEEELTVKEVIEKQQRWTDDETFLEYIIVENSTGRPIGDISLKEIRSPQPKLGIMVAVPEYRGCGVGKEALDLLLGYAEQLGIGRVFAEVYVNNYGSYNFFEKRGFINTGRFFDEKEKECFVFLKEL